MNNKGLECLLQALVVRYKDLFYAPHAFIKIMKNMTIKKIVKQLIRRGCGPGRTGPLFCPVGCGVV